MKPGPTTPAEAWIDERRPWSTPLILQLGQRDTLAAWASNGYPEETCGLFVGRETPTGTCVERVERVRNAVVERAHERFLLAPEEHLRIELAARGEGLDVVGAWHSHPDLPARPSRADLEAAWQGWSYSIVRVTRTGAGELCSWRLDEDVFRPQPVKIVS